MPRKCLLSLAVLLVGLPAAASVLLPLTVEDLAGMSELVIIGEVNEVRSEVDQTGTRIHTRVTITPEETLKGAVKGATVEIKFLGGEIGDIVAKMPGAPTFRAGERVLVFLEPREDGDGYLTLAMYLGKFELVHDAKTGQELAVRQPQAKGVALAGDENPVRRQDVISLDEVRKIVRQVGGGK